MGTVMIITSGKGGTGKTTLCGALAHALCENKRRVLCIDADLGFRNLDIALGMTDSVLMDFADVMEARCPLSRAVAAHPGVGGLFLLTAPLSLSPGPLTEIDFCRLIEEARLSYDFVLIDSPAGLSLGFSLAAAAADEAIVVSMNDLSALRDAQRVVAKLSPSMGNIRLILNRVRPAVFRQLGQTVDDCMDNLGLPLLGLVPEDERVLLSQNAGRALLQGYNKGAAIACRNIAKRLCGIPTPLMQMRGH